MDDFQKDAFKKVKEKLHGLPGFCRLTIYELLDYCDYSSGTITICSLDILARMDFYVSPSRGRAKEDITGDTIRNALRTIKKAKPNDFKFTTVNQRIVIEMPFMRELYESVYNQKQEHAAVLATDVIAATTQSLIDVQGDSEPLLAEELDPKLAAASLDAPLNAPVKNIIKNKTNKLTNTNVHSFAELRKPIAHDFYPSPEIIEIAMQKGLVKVTSDSEIKRFIHYNQSQSTRWADYNYVFLNWLEQDKALLSQPLTQQHHVRTHHHVGTRNTKQATKTCVMDAIARNQRIIDDEQHRLRQTGDVIQSTCINPLDCLDWVV